MPPRPSLSRILNLDYAALSGAVLALGIWVYFILILVFAPHLAWDYGVMAALLSPLGLIIMFVRARLILSVLRNGDRVRGVISSRWFLLERGRLSYEYNYLGQRYTTSNMVYKCRRTKAFEMGDRVTIIVDPDHPEQAFIQELYTRSA